MKMTLGLAGALAACVLAAAPADSSIAFDSSNFEVLPIGQGKGEKLYFVKGTLSVKAQNGSPFICGTARHPVTPGGIARASVKAKGKGKGAREKPSVFPGCFARQGKARNFNHFRRGVYVVKIP